MLSILRGHANVSGGVVGITFLILVVLFAGCFPQVSSSVVETVEVAMIDKHFGIIDTHHHSMHQQDLALAVYLSGIRLGVFLSVGSNVHQRPLVVGDKVIILVVDYSKLARFSERNDRHDQYFFPPFFFRFSAL